MSGIGAFLGQKNRAYRDFQIVFTVLTLNFALPAMSYVVAPQMATRTISQVGEMLGGGPYTFPEEGSRLWRFLGAANVMTLALMCFLLQWNLRRYYATLLPLTFLKAYNASLFLADYLVGSHYPAFLAVAILDFVTSAAFVFFARRAHRAIADVPDADLVPRPFGS